MLATSSGSEWMTSTSMGDGVTADSLAVGVRTATGSVGGGVGGVEFASPPSTEDAEQLTRINGSEAAQASEVKRML